MVKKVLLGVLAIAAVTATGGCGRIALTAPGPTRAALLTPNQPMPTDLRTAEQASREAAGLGKDAPMVFCALGVFDKQGRQQDTNQATVLARFARPGGNRPALRTVYLDFQGKAKTFWGPVDYTAVYGMHLHFTDTWLRGPQDAVALDPAALPSARTAIAWALAAGLTGDEFFVIYHADRAGTEISVAQWQRGADLDTIGAMVHFDPQGHKLAQDEANEDT